MRFLKLPLSTEISHSCNCFSDVNEHDFVVWVSSLVLIILFWTVALAFLVVDLTGCLQKYKTQPGKNSPPDMLKVAEAIATIIFNQTVVSLTFGAGGYWISVGLLGDRDLKEVPTFLHLMRDLLVSYTIFDIGFYMLHRLMHTKYFYKRIHKLHHSWTSPIGVTAIFCHPTGKLSIILSNEPYKMNHFRAFDNKSDTGDRRASCAEVSLLHNLDLVFNNCDHDSQRPFGVSSSILSKFELPLSDCKQINVLFNVFFQKSPQFHDNHHVRFTECFGTSGMMDFIFKTGWSLFYLKRHLFSKLDQNFSQF